MNYSLIDPILNPWADKNGLNVQTEFKESEVRSINIVSPQGRRFQLWVDGVDDSGNTAVHAWDLRKRRCDFQCDVQQLASKLDEAYKQVQIWF